MKSLWGIGTADWHTTFHQPRCRTDDIRQTITKKIDIIAKKSREYAVPILAAGDLLSSCDESYEVVSFLYTHTLRAYRLCYVYGQHDLYNHNLDEAKRGATYFLGKIMNNWECLGGKRVGGNNWSFHNGVHITGCSWGENVEDIKPCPDERMLPKVLVIHKSVWSKKVEASIYHGVKNRNAVENLVMQPEYAAFDLIISGDNHGAFTRRFESSKSLTGSTLWLNCGPILRLKANETTPPYYHEIYKNLSARGPYFSIVSKELPHAELTREHIDVPKIDDALISQFVQSMKKGTKKVAYEDILKALVESTSMSERVRSMVWAAYEKAKSQTR